MEEEIVIRAVHHANELAAAANADKPKKTFKEMVPPEYQSFWDLFSKENFDELPERKPWDHTIELIPNTKSILDCKVYPLNRDEQAQLDKFLDKNLDSGRIQPSKSPLMCSVTASDKRLVGGNDLQPALNLSQLYTITN
ncbi:uncharacterized protein ARMOST_02930 [Armillaria ostoyae]|uniref:Uncharacterized protein n=1 Tax=Armillaria ostoyae TaxID=47428 RepID=A0A284QT02_ARMOS|nr:uncharacterized protein ARMOST_02930 [Armillaria ostoyae]